MRFSELMLLVSLSLCCTESFGQNWTLMNPVGGEQYADNQAVTGNGTGPATGTATFYFEAQDPYDPDHPEAGWWAEDYGSTQTFDFMGMRLWSDTLNPADIFTEWELSPLEGGMPEGDHRVRIKGTNNSEARATGIKVVAH